LDLIIYKIPNIEIFYSESGVLPLDLLFRVADFDQYHQLYKVGLLSLINSPLFLVQLFFCVSLLSAVLLMIGYRTKLFCIIAFICLWSIHQRNPLVISGHDNILICLLFWSMFLPLGRSLSLDFFSKKTISPTISGLPVLAILAQVSVIYFVNAYTKNGVTWQNGQAISYALQEVYWAKSPAQWLLQFPGFCNFSTHAIRFYEYGVPLLIFFPFYNSFTRLFFSVSIVIFHLFIFVFLDVGLFHFTGLMIAVLLLPPLVWEKMRLFIFINEWFEKRKVLRNTIAIEEEIIQKSDKKKTKKAKNISSGLPAAERFLVWKRDVVLLPFFLLIILINGFKFSFVNESISKPEFLKHLEASSLFLQDWNMYAPDPSSTHGWIRIEGITAESSIDINTKKPFREMINSKDNLPYKNFPWQNFIYRTCIYTNPFSKVYQHNLAVHEMKKWNENNPDNKLEKLKIWGFYQAVSAIPDSEPVVISLLTEVDSDDK